MTIKPININNDNTIGQLKQFCGTKKMFLDVYAAIFEEVYHDDTDFISNFWDNRKFEAVHEADIERLFEAVIHCKIQCIDETGYLGWFKGRRTFLADFDCGQYLWFLDEGPSKPAN